MSGMHVGPLCIVPAHKLLSKMREAYYIFFIFSNIDRSVTFLSYTRSAIYTIRYSTVIRFTKLNYNRN
jgi:hypothetical protein